MSLSARALKYGIHGAITYGALYYVSGGAKSVSVLGQDWSLPVVGLALGAVSSVANDLLHWGVAQTHLDDKLQLLGGTAVALGSGAATTVGFSYIANPALMDQVGMGKLAAVGAGSEVLASYAYDKIGEMLGYKPAELHY